MQVYLYLSNISFCLSILGSSSVICEHILQRTNRPPFQMHWAVRAPRRKNYTWKGLYSNSWFHGLFWKLCYIFCLSGSCFLSVEGEILNITFSFIKKKMLLFIWSGFYSVLFICPNAPNITSVLKKCSALSLWIRPPCQACHTSDISIAFCSYMVIEISKVPYRTLPIFILWKNDWLSQWYSSYSSQNSCRMCSIPMEQVRKYKI